MRSASLLMLAACSASTPGSLVTAPAQAEIPAPAPAPTPAPQVTESNATYATDGNAQPPSRPVQTYPLAPRTVAALAREKLRGQVLVSGLVFPSEAAARSVVTTSEVQ